VTDYEPTVLGLQEGHQTNRKRSLTGCVDWPLRGILLADKEVLFDPLHNGVSSCAKVARYMATTGVNTRPVLTSELGLYGALLLGEFIPFRW
jgi:hypothetical protein